jgi:hypothetical protein
MPPIEPVPPAASILKELADFQSAMYDKASTYTKVIMGLGYGGFFAAWSGTKAHLSPKVLVGSALLVTLSLVLFIVFEVFQAMIASYLSIEFAGTVSKPGGDVSAALLAYNKKASRLTTPLLSVWKIVFPVSAITGLAGAGTLIYAFVASLLRMWAGRG